MPIAKKDLGKYRRPGIFIEEINKDIIQLPIQDELVNLVPGFSKKGPINRPVYVESRNEFESIFGEIDRQLERKGSYFHRTVIKMLESGPVWALNLLNVEDDRDKLQWASISLSSKYENYGTTVERNIPYSKIFNRQDFWEQDDEAFLDYLKTLEGQWSENRLLEMVNVGEKPITVFLFKSDAPGFDITAEEWYNGADKVPPYIHPKDWISDWLVTIFILRGDWTNYKDLSVDSKWGQYFTESGLLKDRIEEFTNEKNVTVLGFSDVSLIPYFKDLDGNDMYIKSIVNNNTDNWKLFISYNEESILDSEYPIDTVDIIGNSLVNSNKEMINFMSYNQSIMENVTFNHKPLNSPGNTFAISDDFESSDLTDAVINSRGEADYTKWYVHGVTSGTTNSNISFVTGATSGDTIETIEDHGLSNNEPIYFNNTFSVIEKNKIYYVYKPTSLNNNQFKLKSSYDPDDVLDQIEGIEYNDLSIPTIAISSYWNVLYNDSDNYYVIDDKYWLNRNAGETESIPLNTLDLVPEPTENKTKTDILYFERGNKDVLVGDQFTDFSEGDKIILGTIEQEFITGSTISGSTISLTFNPVSIDGNGYRNIPLTVTSGGTDTMMIDLSHVDGEDYDNIRRDLAHNLLQEKVQDGASLNKFVLINLENGYKKHVGSDYIIDDNSIAFTNLDNPSDYYDGNKFLTHFVDDEFYIDGKTDRLITNEQPVEDLSSSGMTGVNAAGVIGKHSLVYDNYYDGIIKNNDYFYKYNDPSQVTQIFLRMYMDENGDLTVDLVNAPNSNSPQPIDGWDNPNKYDKKIEIKSQTGSLSQNVELKNISQYQDLTSVNKIWVDRTRYPELKLGSLLERYYNPDELELGQTPKKFVRVIRTTNDETNINWKIVETDGPIKIYKVGDSDDYQTVQYSTIEDYVDEYKGIDLKPFKISKESMPNGTDTRQNYILSAMGKTTNLFKGLVNKNKISWRYLIDSFGLGLNVSAYPGGSKQQYADLCGKKNNGFAFVNMPSSRDLKNSVNPYFLDDSGALDTAKLMDGGDLDRNPPYLYEFATGEGQSNVGYFFPFVRQVSQSGIPIEVPPSSYVATTYMQKFVGGNGNLLPWTIMAGIDNGRVEGIGGTEMDFNNEDLENLHQMGANPIVFKKNAGYCINSENTALVFPRSSLSYIHSREVLIELENRLYDMLLRYQWKFNTPDVRSEIKYKADKICKEIQDDNGLYDFENVINSSNNTDYIISLQMGVLDTYVEIIKGMGKLVNNITILEKGAIESGGFRG